MITNKIIKHLEETRSTIDELYSPSSPGVYAIYLTNKDKLPFPDLPHNGLIYIGMSSNLAQREFDTHFRSGNSGFSTLRRSLGAILKDDLMLEPIPRSSGSKPHHYKFEMDGEIRLTGWMTENLEIGICEISVDDYKSLEKELINDLKPVLCLQGWSNPYSRAIKAFRKECANIAKSKMA